MTPCLGEFSNAAFQSRLVVLKVSPHVQDGSKEHWGHPGDKKEVYGDGVSLASVSIAELLYFVIVAEHFQAAA